MSSTEVSATLWTRERDLAAETAAVMRTMAAQLPKRSDVRRDIEHRAKRFETFAMLRGYYSAA